MDQNEVVTVITSTRVSIQMRDTEEVEMARTRFCSVSFEEVAKTFMGDMHPKAVDFITFYQIEPALPDGQTSIVVDCKPLEAVFAFGHELVHD